MPLTLYTKRYRVKGQRLWWICYRNPVEDAERRHLFYTDATAPDGYCYTSRNKAEQMARELEQTFANEHVTQAVEQES